MKKLIGDLNSLNKCRFCNEIFYYDQFMIQHIIQLHTTTVHHKAILAFVKYLLLYGNDINE